MSKKITLVLVILASALFLTGCTWFGGEEEADDVANPELENVEVVEDSEDDNEQVIEDVEEDLPEEEEEVAEPEEETSEEQEAETDAAGAQNIGTATASENASVNAYSYEVAGGKMIFSWKVSANDDAYPKASAVRNSDNTIVVTFPSVVRDSVAKEEKTTSLGTNLPELTWMPSGSGSKYEFKYSTEKDFTLSTQDKGEEGMYVMISIDF